MSDRVFKTRGVRQSNGLFPRRCWTVSEAVPYPPNPNITPLQDGLAPMTQLEFYGIPNCDTVKKARKWLDGQGLPYQFHDYKKEGADPARLAAWADAVGWEVILNRRGTAYRKLDDAQKDGINRDKAIALMAEHPSMIKRPVVEYAGGVLVGFSEAEWVDALA